MRAMAARPRATGCGASQASGVPWTAEMTAATPAATDTATVSV